MRNAEERKRTLRGRMRDVLAACMVIATASTRRVAVASLLLLAVGNAMAEGGPASRGPSLIGIDHMPTAVEDLEGAVASYERLGFSVKPRRFHDDGLRNGHVKFEDGSGVELISPLHQATGRVARTYAGFLRGGDGPAYIAFHARDTAALILALDKAGIPFRGEGGLISIADPDLDFVFFVRDNRSPTDRPEHFAHPNTAIAMSEVWLALDAPGRRSLRRLLLALGAVGSDEVALVPTEARAEVFAVRNGRVVVVGADRQLQKGRPIIGVKFRVRNLQAAGRFLGTAGDLVAPSVAHGLWLRFGEQP